MLGIWGGASRRKVQVRDEQRNEAESARGCRSRASATRSSTRSSSRSATRTAGTPSTRSTTRASRSTSSSRSSRSSCRSSTRARSRTSPRTRRTGRTSRRSCSRASRAASFRGFQNFTTTKPSDMLRLNVAIPPTTTNPNALGLVGGDLAGFPNGRRVFDDVVSIELKAIAGATIPLVDPSFTPDGAVGAVSSYLTPGADRYQSSVPVPRHAPRRIRHALVVTHNHDHSTDARPEHVMLDLGPGVGALVLHTGADLHGAEIEISPAGRDDERSHKQVHERPVGGRPLYAAVFDSPARRRVHALARRPAAAARRRRRRRGRHRHLDRGGTRMIGLTSPTHLALLLLIALLLFGAKRRAGDRPLARLRDARVQGVHLARDRGPARDDRARPRPPTDADAPAPPRGGGDARRASRGAAAADHGRARRSRGRDRRRVRRSTNAILDLLARPLPPGHRHARDVRRDRAVLGVDRGEPVRRDPRRAAGAPLAVRGRSSLRRSTLRPSVGFSASPPSALVLAAAGLAFGYGDPAAAGRALAHGLRHRRTSGS